MPQPRVLYSSPVCPFAHRIVALLTVLDLPFELRNTSLYLKDPEFMRQSPTGKVPLLVEPDGTVLYESSVIAEYLNDRYDFGGLAVDPVLRAQQRLVMKQFDQVLVKLLYYRDIQMYPLRLRTPREGRSVTAELDLLESVVAQTEPNSLLGLHVAPFWLRFRWLSFLIGAERFLRRRPALATWLDEAAGLPEIQATADKAAFTRQYYVMKVIIWLTLLAAFVSIVARVAS